MVDSSDKRSASVLDEETRRNIVELGVQYSELVKKFDDILGVQKKIKEEEEKTKAEAERKSNLATMGVAAGLSLADPLFGTAYLAGKLIKKAFSKDDQLAPAAQNPQSSARVTTDYGLAKEDVTRLETALNYARMDNPTFVSAKTRTALSIAGTQEHSLQLIYTEVVKLKDGMTQVDPSNTDTSSVESNSFLSDVTPQSERHDAEDEKQKSSVTRSVVVTIPEKLQALIDCHKGKKEKDEAASKASLSTLALGLIAGAGIAAVGAGAAIASSAYDFFTEGIPAGTVTGGTQGAGEFDAGDRQAPVPPPSGSSDPLEPIPMVPTFHPVMAGSSTASDAMPVRGSSTVPIAEEVPASSTSSEGRVTPTPSVYPGQWYVTGFNVNLRAMPNTSAAILDTLNNGDKINLVKMVNGWAHVIAESGQRGYIYGDFVTNDWSKVESRITPSSNATSNAPTQPDASESRVVTSGGGGEPNTEMSTWQDVKSFLNSRGFNPNITSTTGGEHTAGSYHYSGHGLDIGSGSYGDKYSPILGRIFRELEPFAIGPNRQIDELMYNHMPTNWDNGARIGHISGHWNHIHIGVRRGARPSSMQAGSVTHTQIRGGGGSGLAGGGSIGALAGGGSSQSIETNTASESNSSRRIEKNLFPEDINNPSIIMLNRVR